MSIRIEQASATIGFVDRPRQLAADGTSRLSISPEATQKPSNAVASQFASGGNGGSASREPAKDTEELWGEIIIEGKSVAQIYRSGVISWDAAYHQLPGHASASPSGIADQILRQIGGTLVLSGTGSISLSL
jgi:hypothetical protein